jgi:hypothetical protein
MSVFTVTVLAFAFLELGKSRLKKYAPESHYQVLSRGSRSICNILGVPTFIIWVTTTLTLLWSNVYEILSISESSFETGIDIGFGQFTLLVFFSIFFIVASVAIILPRIGYILGGLVLDLHYLLSP